MGIADMIKDHRLLLPMRATESPADRLQVKGQAGGGAHQDRVADRGDVGALAGFQASRRLRKRLKGLL